MAKRKTKTLEKKSFKSDSIKTKIGKLQLGKGASAIFAICEIGKDYLIVNHTRNTKGYIAVSDSNQFRLGQLLVATVSSEIGGADTGKIYNFSSGKAGLNRKVQLNLDRSYKQLSEDSLSKGMMLQCQVESKEAKGYILNLGFKDNCKGFLKTSDELKKG
jgi:hypothetical protein